MDIEVTIYHHMYSIFIIIEAEFADEIRFEMYDRTYEEFVRMSNAILDYLRENGMDIEIDEATNAITFATTTEKFDVGEFTKYIVDRWIAGRSI